MVQVTAKVAKVVVVTVVITMMMITENRSGGSRYSARTMPMRGHMAKETTIADKENGHGGNIRGTTGRRTSNKTERLWPSLFDFGVCRILCADFNGHDRRVIPQHGIHEPRTRTRLGENHMHGGRDTGMSQATALARHPHDRAHEQRKRNVLNRLHAKGMQGLHKAKYRIKIGE